MTAKFFALLTHQGAAALSNAAALGTKVQITHMGIGDGGGTLPTPTGTQTRLINEKRRAVLNGLSIDTANSSQIIAEQIIPENEGGFWIREIGLYDSDNTLIAVANCPETYKPMLAEGSGRTQTVRMILIINSTDAVTLKIDPAVVLATRQYVDEAIIQVKVEAGLQLAAHVAASDPHSQYVKTADITHFIPVGIPLPYPLATPPAGWLKCNGAPFDKTHYPALAVVYPSGNLPDLRGEFLRGWDDGRGVDSGRNLLSMQGDAIRNITGTLNDVRFNTFPSESGAFTTASIGPASADSVTGGNARRVYFDASKVVPTANENRPRSIAFNYIVRAA